MATTKGEDGRETHTFSGVWEKLWNFIYNIKLKGITLDVLKVKTYTDLNDNISPMHRMENDIADREAKHAAHDHDLPKAETDPIKEMDRRTITMGNGKVEIQTKVV